ncbi:MAG: NAD(P)-dependent oxidoreductase [Saccharofermentans sp.]|jgi:nucleoside-diphosphate-sugar epimerase|nr:NAD(P)-dependent oxidoreductase [Mageeibacillus sp.]MCI1263488.1 NAD(P)-dependent oxidoreductase [Saccharofermentans sp.]MCI1275427.1 NAD(P)-dependent oxidoreductase [Saccharofermentans sp.]MCI2044174.1 NAD(P)-dependent oxidoreductase [Mageeibacillus sp.]
MKAIVTGATGMLAIATVNRLVEEGYEVICVARPDSSRLGNIPVSDRITVISLDLENIYSLADIMKTEGLDEDCELFFHFGWDGTHGDSRNDMNMQLRNIRYSVEAARTAAAIGCKTFLGAGSQAEYGRVNEGTKLAGDTPCFPENGYGIGKLCAGQMTRIECAKLGIRHIWVRILSTYGPFDGAHTMVMSGIGQMLDGKRASYTRGEQLWDYLYCKDAAKAFVLAAQRGKDGRVYPVGSGMVRPLSDYIKDIRDAVNPELSIGFGEVDYYPGQVMYLCADISQLSEDTGFVPEYTFREGIEETVDWYRREYRS